MGPAARTSAALASAAGIWCVLGAIAAPVATSASTRLGLLPPMWVLLLLMVACAILWLRAATRPVGRDRLLPLLVLPILVLPWWPGPVPAAFLLWTGRLGWAVAAVAIGCAAWQWGRPRVRLARLRLEEPRRALPLAFVLSALVFLAGGWALQGMVPGGDEPHYLVITQSLLRDGDLQIENNHRDRDYAPYFGRTLRPDYLRRGTNRQIYSIHAPGIAAFVAPAFAVAGYPGALVWLALVCAAGTALAWYVSWRLTARAGAAWYAWASGTFSVSFTIQAFSVYPDATASVIALTGVLSLVLPVGRPAWQWALHGAALALLPWLHTRHAVLAGLLGAFIVLRLLARAPRPWRQVAAFAAVPCASAIGWFSYFLLIYGTPSPSAPYGTLRQTSSLSFLPVTLPGLLFDQQFGLVAYAPVLGVALAGLGLLAVRRSSIVARPGEVDGRWLALQLGLIVVVYAAASGTYRMWWAGASSPARFLVPIVLPLTVGAGAAWAGLRTRASRWMASAALVATLAITAVLMSVDGGRLAFNWRDGYALLADWLSPAADLSRALPSLIRDALPVARVRIAAWLIAALGAWLALRAIDRHDRLGPGARTLAGCSMLLIAAMGATTIGWRAEAAAAPLRAGAGQAWLLARAGGPVPLGTGVRYSPWPVPGGRSSAIDAIALRAEERDRLGPDELLVVRDVPAGQYAVQVETVPGTRGGAVAVAVGRGPAIASRDLAETGDAGAASLEFDLPVAARAIAVTADEAAQARVRSVWLVPRGLAARPWPGGARALAGTRLGGATVFALDDRAFVEPGGVWVRPGGPVRFVVGRHAPGRVLTARIGGGPIANTCVVVAGAWRRAVTLAAGETLDVAIPMTPQATAAEVSVEAAHWFRPSEVDPQSQDGRALGCRVEFP